MKRQCLFAIASSLLVGSSEASFGPKTKDASDVFSEWVSWQRTYKHQDLTCMQEHINDNFWRYMYRAYSHHRNVQEPLQKLFGQSIKNKNSLKKDKNVQILKNIYAWLNNDILAFITFLQNHSFASEELNEKEEEESLTKAINKYTRLFHILFKQKPSSVQDELLFTVANNLFEFCFSKEHFPEFEKLLKAEQQYPIARLIYSNIWTNLVETGWKEWHHDCLENLKTQHDAGKKIVYIAGGNDIYQLIKNGIYNIEVIDPILPSQPDYYSKGWEWLIRKNGIGDQITLDFKDRNLLMKRTRYTEGKYFTAELSTGKSAKLKESKTTWTLFNLESNKKLGTIVFNRRFAKQEDFAYDPKKAHLISFNEMYLSTAIAKYGGWGIKPGHMSQKTPFFIKQLRKPVYKSTLLNLRKADQAPFPFMVLGSCAT